VSGWFSVKRGITLHPIFKGHADRLAIWIWLIDNAAWRDTPHDVNGKTITVPRGCVSASERRIAKEVGVGYQVVRTFLARLRDEHMINATVTQGRSLIRLCNYDKYQTPPDTANAAPNAAVTQDQRTKEQVNNSVSKDTADFLDPAKVAFDSGIAMLTAAGKTEAAARKIVGKWKSDFGAEAVIVAIGKAKREDAADPVAFITGCLRHVSRTKGAEDEFGAFGKIRSVG
jgi:hypothetical protein